jgi:hypothetical protein
MLQCRSISGIPSLADEVDIAMPVLSTALAAIAIYVVEQ